MGKGYIPSRRSFGSGSTSRERDVFRDKLLLGFRSTSTERDTHTQRMNEILVEENRAVMLLGFGGRNGWTGWNEGIWERERRGLRKH